MVRHRGRTRRRAPQVRQTLPFYMVAWCEWSPCASRRRIPGLLLIFMASEIKPSAAAELTLLPKERPLAAEMKAWVEENLTRLPPDQRALVMGRRSLHCCVRTCARGTGRSGLGGVTVTHPFAPSMCRITSSRRRCATSRRRRIFMRACLSR